MLNFDLITILITSTIILALGLFVFLNNKSSRVSQSFFAITIFASLWSVAAFFTENATKLSLNNFFNHVTYLFAFLVVFSAAIFSMYFPAKSSISNKKRNLFAIFGIIFGIFSCTSYTTGTISQTQDGLSFHSSPYLIIYILGILFLLSIIALNLLKVSSTEGKEERAQARIILAGLGLGIITGIIANGIMPILYPHWESLKFIAPIILLFVGSIAFAVLKYGLFDIRSFISSLVSYLFSIFFIVLSYTLLAFIIINNVLFPSLKISFAQQLLYALLAVLIGLTFQPLISIVSAISNKIFYSDNYDSQDVLNKLNTQLVNSGNLEQLASSSINILEDNLHSRFMCLAIEVSDNKYQYYYGYKKIKLTDTEEHQLALYISGAKTRTYLYDSNNSGQKSSINQILKQHKIALISKLIVGKKLIGFEFFGYRKSGNIYSNRDIQFLETAADSIAIAAQNALRYEEIAQFNITLQKRIEDATHQLQKSNTKLLALDDAKDEFISMASHQLRTPLTVVNGNLSMVLEDDISNLRDTQRKLLNQSFVSGQRMAYLIADLLNVSRVQTGKFMIDPKPTYLPDVAKSEIVQLAETIKARGLTLKFIAPKKFPVLNLDETKTRQVIMNFIDNAIYYSPKDSTITVRLVVNKESVEYTVTDEGIGVPKHDQHHLFTKFYRASNARKVRPDGTGLGLFLAKKVIVAEGGAIIFKTTEGKGSTFGFSFPREKLEAKTINNF